LVALLHHILADAEAEQGKELGGEEHPSRPQRKEEKDIELAGADILLGEVE
jgi:hypothetical protein